MQFCCFGSKVYPINGFAAVTDIQSNEVSMYTISFEVCAVTQVSQPMITPLVTLMYAAPISHFYDIF